MTQQSAYGACRSCDAPIIWARTDRGRSMPVDREPAPAGNVAVTPDPARPGHFIARVVRRDLAFGRTDLHWPHHGTCPQGPRWKRKKGTPA